MEKPGPSQRSGPAPSLPQSIGFLPSFSVSCSYPSSHFQTASFPHLENQNLMCSVCASANVRPSSPRSVCLSVSMNKHTHTHTYTVDVRSRVCPHVIPPYAVFPPPTAHDTVPLWPHPWLPRRREQPQRYDDFARLTM